MLAELGGARHPVDVCLAPTEAERRLRSNGAIRCITSVRMLQWSILQVNQMRGKRPFDPHIFLCI
jgi:hypothetical protein